MGTPLTNEDMWANYQGGLAAAAGLPNPDEIVMLGTARPANFNTHYKPKHGTKPNKAEAAYQLYELGNTLAAQNAVYTATNQLFFDDYATYLDNLNPKGAKPPTAAQKTKIHSDRATLATAATNYRSAIDKAYTEYNADVKKFGAGRWANFVAWLAQSPSASTVKAAESAVAGASTTLSTLMNSVYGSDYVAIAAARQACDQVRSDMLTGAPNGPAEMAIEDGLGAKRVAPAYGIGDLKVYSKWVESTDKHPPKTPAASVSFNATQGHYDMSKSAYYSHTDWSAGFWFISTSGSQTSSGSQLNIDSASSSFGVKMDFEGVTEIDGIAPGPWYDSSLMYDWVSPLAGDTLSLPTSLIIVLKPTITLTLDQADYQKADAAFQKSGSMHVGGWFVSVNHETSSSGEVMTSSWDSTHNTITITQAGNQPLLVGARMTEVQAGGVNPQTN